MIKNAAEGIEARDELGKQLVEYLRSKGWQPSGVEGHYVLTYALPRDLALCVQRTLESEGDTDGIGS